MIVRHEYKCIKVSREKHFVTKIKNVILEVWLRGFGMFPNVSCHKAIDLKLSAHCVNYTVIL